MKTKQKKELAEKSKDELKTQLLEKRKDLFSKRLEHVQKKLKNTRSLFTLRKEIAQILSYINRKDQKHENA